MSKRMSVALAAVGMILTAAPSHAVFPKSPVASCSADAVVVGSTCMDKYEASVWRIPALNLAGKSNAGLIKKIRNGTANAAALAAGGASQLGTAGDDYAPCNDNGQNCTGDIYAVSLPGVTPAVEITWFQAQEACTNSGKRLPSNAEWQAAANGTPDPGPDNGTTDCNTSSTLAVAPTGSRSGCVSARGAFDMVGNLYEWVADWVPRSTACPGWGAFSNDDQCLAGADAVSTTGPSGLLRGGRFVTGTSAGPFAIDGTAELDSAGSGLGFRCAR